VGAPKSLIQRQRRRRELLNERIGAPLVWQGATQQVSDTRADDWVFRIPSDQLTALRAEVDNLLKTAQKTTNETRLREIYNEVAGHLADALRDYDGEEALVLLRERLLNFIQSREDEENIGRRALTRRHDLEFGPVGVIKATRLGNILEAIDNYPYSRYRIEGSVFWPHLELKMKDELLEDIQNQRILLDFVLALASLFGLLAVFALVLGPWIWLNAIWIWILVFIIAGVLSYGTYLISLPTSFALSRSLRAGCDLYRQDLLFALGVEAPETLDDERADWQRLSRLVIYGGVRGLRFRKRRPPPDDWDT
jgi:hypothetical protein